MARLTEACCLAAWLVPSRVVVLSGIAPAKQGRSAFRPAASVQVLHARSLRRRQAASGTPTALGCGAISARWATEQLRRRAGAAAHARPHADSRAAAA